MPILGRPLIEWVWRRVREIAALDAVVVATDAEAVAEVCHRIGAVVEMTRSDHPSGTDRVAEVVARAPWRDFPLVVNVQGDEPLLRDAEVAGVVRMLRAGWPVATCAAPLRALDAAADPAVVKVARTHEGRALYFSRAAIPHRRDGAPTEQELGRPPFLRHVGVYGYTRTALERWVALPPSPLEQIERLEQLRPLEAGFDIGVAVVESAEGGVDTPADALRIERRLSELRHGPLAE